MTPRELRLRERIDDLIVQRDRALALAEDRRVRLESTQRKLRATRQSRDHWRELHRLVSSTPRLHARFVRAAGVIPAARERRAA